MEVFPLNHGRVAILFRRSVKMGSHLAVHSFFQHLGIGMTHTHHSGVTQTDDEV